MVECAAKASKVFVFSADLSSNSLKIFKTKFIQTTTYPVCSSSFVKKYLLKQIKLF